MKAYATLVNRPRAEAPIITITETIPTPWGSISLRCAVTSPSDAMPVRASEPQPQTYTFAMEYGDRELSYMFNYLNHLC